MPSAAPAVAAGVLARDAFVVEAKTYCTGDWLTLTERLRLHHPLAPWGQRAGTRVRKRKVLKYCVIMVKSSRI